MSLYRHASTAIVLGTVASIVTMALHPTGADAIRVAEAGGHNALIRGVHLLAVFAQPLLLAGTAALTWRLRSSGSAMLGMASFTLAVFAVMIAAAASGLVAPHVAESLAGTVDAERALLLELLHYTGAINRAFASLYVMLTGMAVLSWSWAMRGGDAFPSALTWLGFALGAAGVFVGSTGVVPLDVIGFGAVVLAQAVWMVWMALALRKA